MGPHDSVVRVWERTLGLVLAIGGAALGVAGTVALSSQRYEVVVEGGGCLYVPCPVPGVRWLPLLSTGGAVLMVVASGIPLVGLLRARRWWVGGALTAWEGLFGLVALFGTGPGGAPGVLTGAAPPYPLTTEGVAWGFALWLAAAVVTSTGLWVFSRAEGPRRLSRFLPAASADSS
jgi:hypothetical protein